MISSYLPLKHLDLELYPSSDEIDILDNLDLNIDVSTERLSYLDAGKDLDRHPGTDANDDVHVLSPFTKRKGNATENNQVKTMAVV